MDTNLLNGSHDLLEVEVASLSEQSLLVHRENRYAARAQLHHHQIRLSGADRAHHVILRLLAEIQKYKNRNKHIINQRHT